MTLRGNGFIESSKNRTVIKIEVEITEVIMSPATSSKLPYRHLRR